MIFVNKADYNVAILTHIRPLKRTCQGTNALAYRNNF